MPAFEAMEGMPYWQDLATSDTQKSTYFYSKLLGWDISADAYRIARTSGLPVAGFIPQLDDATMTDAWVIYFFTRDLGRDLGGVEKLGGTVLARAEVSLGEMSLCADPAGAVFGLIQPAGEDQFVAAGEPGTPVWHEYVGVDKAKECIDFYAELFDWEVSVTDGYYTALREGAPFLGMRDESGREELEGMAGFWELYMGVADARAAAQTAAELGGEVLVAPEQHPFGVLSVIGDSTGATLTVCTVDAPVADDLSEAESILDL
ncbi:VOC family protein [Corynebacterium sp. LK2510]|uniref:VOC family protein n=1 Tax=Corynebacterium sp. LK2510 TaxID=3110472 RepID=UPI0034CEC49B